MAKPKLNVKELLLKKGEYIALGVAAFGLVILLLMGVTTWTDAKNPTEISKNISDKASAIQSSIANPNDPTKPEPLPLWAADGKQNVYIPVGIDEFRQYDTLFDPTGRPDTKRVNPNVYGIEDYQVDLVRGAMPGYDIIFPPEGGAQIAVRVTKKLSEVDREKLKNALEKIRRGGGRGIDALHRQSQNAPGFGPGGQGGGPVGLGGAGGGLAGPGGGGPAGPGGGVRPPGAGGPPPGAGGGPPSGSAGGPPPGAAGGLGLGFGGPMGGGFDGGLQRSDIAIAYIPIEDLDKAAADNKLPAQTVIPLRMIVVNCTIPMKKQLEELKRAMRFQTIDQARPYLKYDGFEVKRKITQIRPTGEVVVIQDWANYKYEDKYVELINSRRLSDHVEGTDKTNKQGPYLPYFYRYEDSLVMPLPELVPELGSYPHIRLKSIVETIDKLESGRTPKVDPSDLIKRLQQKGSRKDLFNLSGASDTGAGDLFGKGGPGGGIMDIGKVGAPGKGGNEAKGGGLENQQQVNIDELLLRFVDCDVQPGLAYEYQIQLLMVNPNFGPSQIPNVSNPVDTKKRILTSQWIPLPGSLIVPTEDFLYAYDRNAYFSEIAENYKTQKILQGFLQVKENQTVVQAVKWMESIRMEGKHEPIGGWVVAEIPVGRGDYIGKKTYVKLPLWSSESNQYILREIPGEIIKKAKDQQPRGWMVDFSSKSILVDFDGGKVTTRTASGRTLPIEEVATEMLIVRSDGKLAVRRSIDDSLDQNRKDLTGIWDGWIKKVEARPTSTGTDTGGNAFDRKP